MDFMDKEKNLYIPFDQA